MNTPEQSDYAPQTGRRENARVRLWIPCELILIDGKHNGFLEDLSCTGARVAIHSPPKSGSSAIIRWGGDEFFCTVTWARKTSCGLHFEEATLTKEDVLQARWISENYDKVEREQCRNWAKNFVQGHTRPTHKV